MRMLYIFVSYAVTDKLRQHHSENVHAVTALANNGK